MTQVRIARDDFMIRMDVLALGKDPRLGNLERSYRIKIIYYVGKRQVHMLASSHAGGVDSVPVLNS
jgi:hypothetical protein